MRRRKPDLKAILDNFLDGFSDKDMHNYLMFLTAIVGDLAPFTVLEVGTGDGLASRMMMQTMPRDSLLTTMFYPEQTRQELTPWIGDRRLKVMPVCTSPSLGAPIDLLFIHEVAHSQQWWQTLRQSMGENAVVLVDAVRVRDADWWRQLPYNKIDTSLHGDEGFGMFVVEQATDADIKKALNME